MSKRPPPPAIELSPAEKFFGLKARPFSLTPDLRFVYHSRSHTHALEQLNASLKRREGLIVVTGSIGTGKTMLCRTLLETFDARMFLSLVLDPALEVEDLLRKLLADFGIMKEFDDQSTGPMTNATRHRYVVTLQQFLASLIPLQAHAVVMIDEAQHLSPRVLEELRLLSNFETDEAKLLQIVLVGQPDLDDLLLRPELRQLNQRVARRCELEPLSQTEVSDYIERRLAVASKPLGEPDVRPSFSDEGSVQFTPDGAATVAMISGGVPRLVNTLSDRALDVAYEQQQREIDPSIVIEAAERLRLVIPSGLPIRRPRRWLVAAAIIAVLAILAGAGWWWWTTRAGGTPVAPPLGFAPASVAPPTSQAPSPAEPTASPPTASPPSQAAEGTRSTASPASPPERPSPAPPTSAPASTAAPASSSASPSPAPQASAAPRAPSASASPAASSTSSASDQPAAELAAPVARNDADDADEEPAAADDPAPGAFMIAVASFRTQQRAQLAAQTVTRLSLPVTIRLDSDAGWYRVLSGPYETRDAAEEAQARLGRRGYSGTRISRMSPAP